MNPQKQILKAAAATAVLGLLSAGPAQAFSFNDVISFNEDTRVNFDFVESHGWFKSGFGVKNTATGEETLLLDEIINRDAGNELDELGTCEIALEGNCSAEFIFQAGTTYEFFLKRVRPDNNQELRNLSSTTHAKFFQGTSVLDDLSYREYDTSPDSALGTTAGIDDANPFDGPVLIAFDDEFNLNGVTSHVDYNDFLVTATAATPVAVPEPATLAGLGLVVGGMALSRRRKENRA